MNARPAVAILYENGRWSLQAVMATYGDTFAWCTPEQRAQIDERHRLDMEGWAAISAKTWPKK